MSGSAKSILLLEDDADDLENFEQALTEYTSDYELTVVSNGAIFMQLINQLTPPDIIVLDLNVPRITGLDCLSQIRCRKALDMVPVYILTGSRNFLEKEKCVAAGATKYFTKPFDFSTTKLIVKEICDTILNIFPPDLRLSNR
jgi:CheY-like chemotaxis protein